MSKFILNITAAVDKIYTAGNVPTQKKNNTRRTNNETLTVTTDVNGFLG